jgi:anti-anti-sigma factor
MTTSSLHVDLGADDDGALVRLRGDLDASTSPELWARIDELDPAVPVTVLDLAELTFVDSTGIGCLFRLHQRVADGGGMVVARNPSPQLRRLMEMTQLNRLIAILD